MTRVRHLSRLLAGTAVLLCAVATPAGAELTDIALTPASGPVGTDVTISGGSCKEAGPDPATVEIRGPTLGVELTIDARANGSWSGTFTVPSDATEGDHLVTADCIIGSEVTQYHPVTFTLTAAPPLTTTTSSVNTTVPPPTATSAVPGTVPPSDGEQATGPSAPPLDPDVTTSIAGTAAVPVPGGSAAPTPAPATTPGVIADASGGVTPATGDSTGSAEPGGQALGESFPPGGTGSHWLRLALLAAAAAATAGYALHRAGARRQRRGARRGAFEQVLVGPEPRPVDALLLTAGTPPTETHEQMTEPARVDTATIHTAPVELASVDIGGWLREKAAHIRTAAAPFVSVQLDVQPNVCLAQLAAGDLGRLIFPLVDDAARALVNGGAIRIATGRGPYTAVTATGDDHDWALVVLTETGPDTPTDVAAEWCDSFGAGGTDTPSGRLSVQRIVAERGGHIDVTSVRGQGTTVTIALPLHEPPAESTVGDENDIVEVITVR